MRFLILAACLALATADGGDGEHHHHHDPAAAPSSGYAAPADTYQAAAPAYGAPPPAAAPPSYGAPAATPSSYGAPAAPAYNAPVADAYGAPQEAPVYAPPAQEYGAPQQEYAQETYGAPQQQEYAQETYGAPAAADNYGAPAVADGYGAPEAAAPQNTPTSYNAATTALADVMDMSRLAALLPILVAIGAAILVAQIFGPLLGGLFGLKAAGIAGFLAPLGALKVSLINILLAPTGLIICNTGPPLAPAVGREAASGFEFDQDKIDLVANMMYNAIRSKSLPMHKETLPAIPTS